MATLHSHLFPCCEAGLGQGRLAPHEAPRPRSPRRPPGRAPPARIGRGGLLRGADSAFLAWVAHDALGPERALAVTAVSPSLPAAERHDCRSLAEGWGLAWQEVETDELDNPAYARNDGDRCYWCKDALMRGRRARSPPRRGATVVLGVNVDDLDDHRPGQRAAAERGATFPLVDAGFTKEDVRACSRALGLCDVGQAGRRLPGLPASVRHAGHPSAGSAPWSRPRPVSGRSGSRAPGAPPRRRGPHRGAEPTLSMRCSSSARRWWRRCRRAGYRWVDPRPGRAAQRRVQPAARPDRLSRSPARPSRWGRRCGARRGARRCAPWRPGGRGSGAARSIPPAIGM